MNKFTFEDLYDYIQVVDIDKDGMYSVPGIDGLNLHIPFGRKMVEVYLHDEKVAKFTYTCRSSMITHVGNYVDDHSLEVSSCIDLDRRDIEWIRHIDRPGENHLSGTGEIVRELLVTMLNNWKNKSIEELEAKKVEKLSELVNVAEYVLYEHVYEVLKYEDRETYIIKYYHKNPRVSSDTFFIKKETVQSAAALTWYHLQFTRVRRGLNDTITGDRTKDLLRFTTEFKILTGSSDVKDSKVLIHDEIVEIDDVITSLVVEMKRATNEPYVEIDEDTIKNIKERFDKVYNYAIGIEKKQYMRDISEAKRIISELYNRYVE